MPRSVRCALLAFLLLSPLASPTDLARVHLGRPLEYYVILSAGFDVIEFHASDPDRGETGPPAVDVLLHGDDDLKLARMGFSFEVLQTDLEAAITVGSKPLTQALASGPPNFGMGGMGGFYTFAEIVATIDHYATNYPALVSPKQAIGTTHEGRTIWAFKVSDNPTQTENEPRVLFDALHHAREPMSAHTLLWFVDVLATGYGVDPSITQLVDEREIWFVPCVNPDGYVYNQTTNPGGGGLWRKNRRNNAGSCEGVDLNRNWPTGWAWDNAGSSSDPCSEVYRGPGAASEPEVQAMNQFLTGKSFATAWSMHTYGEWMVEPYGYKPVSPSPAYAEYSADMVAYNGYIAGIAYTLLYPANGAALDHYHDVHGAVAFSPEIGDAFWPPIQDAVAIAEENVEPGLLMVKYAGGWVDVAGLTVVEVAGDGDGAVDPGETGRVVLTLRNKGQADTAASLLVSSPTPDVTTGAGGATTPTVASLTNFTLDDAALDFTVAASVAPGSTLSLEVSLTAVVDSVSHVVVVPITIGSPRVILRDDCEADRGWSAGLPTDDATAGLWERDDPNQVIYNGAVSQPANDATPAPGTDCFVTGNDAASAGSDDVDSGRTTLVTPRFDLTNTAAPHVRYSRHYFNDDNDDAFLVSISNDDGSNWTDLESITGVHNGWTQMTWQVEDFLAKSDRMRLRFIAEDSPNNSITEAAIDDFEVIDFAATPHLGQMGKASPGATFELQLAGAPNAIYLMYLSTGTGTATVSGVTGTFGLDVGSLFFLFSAGLPSNGFVRLPIPVPSNGALVGAKAYFQAIVDLPPPTVSNVAEVTVETP